MILNANSDTSLINEKVPSDLGYGKTIQRINLENDNLPKIVFELRAMLIKAEDEHPQELDYLLEEHEMTNWRNENLMDIGIENPGNIHRVYEGLSKLHNIHGMQKSDSS